MSIEMTDIPTLDVNQRHTTRFELSHQTTLRIGLMSEQARIRLWGRAANQHGFGRGMPYQFANTLYLALLEEERCRTTWPFPITPQDDEAAQSAWRAQLTTIRKHLRTRIDDEFDPIEYEEKNGKRKKKERPARQQFILHDAVQDRFVPYLRAQRILVDLNVARISSDIKLTLDRNLPRTPRWRYATFANIIWYGLAPHLETREMLDPNGVWRKVRHMVRFIHQSDDRFKEMSPKQRRLEWLNFALAIYESTYRLIGEADAHDRRYLDFVVNRKPVGQLIDDQILALPIEPATTNNYEEALWIRRVAYDDLLRQTLMNCYCLMISHAPET